MRRNALWACVAVAILNAVAWAVITPTFQVPDELVHVGYVQYLGETGKLPTPTSVTGTVASEELAVAGGAVPFSTRGHPTWLPSASAQAGRALRAPLDRTEPRSGGYAAANPPLYYALEIIPYKLASSAIVFDRILAMRILSALLAGLLTALVWLFLREALPGSPALAVVGSLGVGLHPLVGFLAGGVTPEVLVWVFSAALFWLLARAFRRGLTWRGGLVLGLVTVGGLLTKLSFLTLVPGLLVALGLLVVSAPRERRRQALIGAGVAVVATVVPFELWARASSAFFGQAAVPGVAATATKSAGSARELVSYVWQFYLPKLPFMTDQFRGYPEYPLWETYFKGFVGRFGWFEYGFPVWVDAVGLVAFASVVAAAASALSRTRREVRRRWAELLAYVAIAGSTALLVNVSGYRYHKDIGDNFEQTRYLFPLLPLYAGLLALAVRAVGPRWRASAAVLLVVVLAGHDVFAQLLTLGRYYL